MPWFTAQASADNPRAAKIVIDRPIGSDWAPDWINDFFGEQPAREFIEAVDALGELDEIDLELNSPGGDVASGIRIMNYLKHHRARVNIRVTGMAASIATVILMAGDTRTMAVGATIMTHRAGSFACGIFTAEELREVSAQLDVIDAAIVEAYVVGTGKNADEINALLDKGDTYMGADEAIEWGFATDKDAKLQAVACADQRFFRQQIQQQRELEQLRAQLAAGGGQEGNRSAMTAADALALAFDVTPEEAEAQAADLGDQILALRQSAVGTVEGVEVTAEWLRDNHADVVIEIEGAAVAALGPVPDAEEVLGTERERVTAIIKACQTTGQVQLMEKLVGNGMSADQVSDYVFDVAAAASNGSAIHNSHSPEGGHRAGIDTSRIYARFNRKAQA